MLNLFRMAVTPIVAVWYFCGLNTEPYSHWHTILTGHLYTPSANTSIKASPKGKGHRYKFLCFLVLEGIKGLRSHLGSIKGPLSNSAVALMLWSCCTPVSHIWLFSWL